MPQTGLFVTAGVGVVTVMDAPNAPQRPYAFVIGSDGRGGDGQHLWANWWNPALGPITQPTAWQWTDHGAQTSYLSVSGGVGAVTVMDNPNAAQKPYAFVIGSDGNLSLNWWNPALGPITQPPAITWPWTNPPRARHLAPACQQESASSRSWTLQTPHSDLMPSCEAATGTSG